MKARTISNHQNWLNGEFYVLLFMNMNDVSNYFGSDAELTELVAEWYYFSLDEKRQERCLLRIVAACRWDKFAMPVLNKA
jgi:hypothetical protein